MGRTQITAAAKKNLCLQAINQIDAQQLVVHLHVSHHVHLHVGNHNFILTICEGSETLTDSVRQNGNPKA